jgi:hypothetical protein
MHFIAAFVTKRKNSIPRDPNGFVDNANMMVVIVCTRFAKIVQAKTQNANIAIQSLH